MNDNKSDLMEIFGFRLPPEIYFFLSQGIVTSQAINNLIQGYLFEAPPLVDSKEYRKTLDDLKEIRTKTLALISTFLHEGISQKPVFTVRWFAPFDKKEMVLFPPPTLLLPSFILSSSFLPPFFPSLPPSFILSSSFSSPPSHLIFYKNDNDNIDNNDNTDNYDNDPLEYILFK